MSAPSVVSRVADAFLDRTVLLSFDRSGFKRHRKRFDPKDVAVDRTGRICIVTGANSGLGRATAIELARRKATVWMLCRNPESGEESHRAVQAASGNPNVHLAIVDIAHRASVTRFVERFPENRVDVLIHNAGVLTAAREETSEGLERTLATNQIGPFLLTCLLEERLQRSPDARVVWVSSGGMYGMSLQLADPDWRMREFDGVRAYAETKRAQVVLSRLWGRRWAGSGVLSAAMHPGWADTPGVRKSLPRFWRRLKGRLRTPGEGADTILWLALRERPVTSGLFWFDRRPVSTHLLPWTRETEEQEQRLWQLCEELSQMEGKRESMRFQVPNR